MIFAIIAIFWVVLSLAIGYLAEMRGRSFGWWTVFAIVISPLSVAILLTVLPPTNGKPALRVSPLEQERLLRKQDRKVLIGTLIAAAVVVGLFLLLIFLTPAHSADTFTGYSWVRFDGKD